MSLMTISQLMIIVTGVAGIYLSQDPREGRRRYACLFGIAAQPFWMYSAWMTGQWGPMIVSCLYGYGWGRGVYFNWIRRRPL